MTGHVRLGDVVDVASGQVDPREEPYCDWPHVGGDNIESGSGRLFGLRTARELSFISGKYEFGPEDVLYSKIRPALNKVALPDFKGICSADMYPLRPRSGRIERRYLAYLLQHDGFLEFAEKHSSRTNIPKINREALLSYEFPLPELPEQHRIADVLEKADSIRRKRKEAIALTEELLRSAFLEMFGDPVTNSNGWPTKTLDEIGTDFSYGTSTKCDTDQTGRAVLRIPNVVGGQIDMSELKYAHMGLDEAQRFMLLRGDLLFVRSNGNPNFIARSAVFNRAEPMLFASYLIRARFPRNSPVSSGFVHALFSADSFRRRLLKEATTTAGNYNINTTGLGRQPIMLPPAALQARYSRVEEAIWQLREKHQQCSRDAEVLFASLSERVFRGGLRHVDFS
ncbi:hypothetical protein D7W82_22510 [Corallococcus sp. CA049B]|uniref:restriction endonuclease subunit S n=1 Tax=Corallococcus sp. CA049B TaxID=2316730 RepID=UPI000EA27B0F|nr:restriction endonuclease subunit S [Corallococcus sp. CA049B]RKG84397.1 hypothetical protein D7W82_22510 [Corallococcus sp. CA049B]